MPFPIDKKFIEQTEKELQVSFPALYKTKMEAENGGQVEFEDIHFILYPFFDQSNKKRISRTCNHIGLETQKAKEWNNFPNNATAIGSDGGGNQLVLIHTGDYKLLETIYFWDHETGELEEVSKSIIK